MTRQDIFVQQIWLLKIEQASRSGNIGLWNEELLVDDFAFCFGNALLSRPLLCPSDLLPGLKAHVVEQFCCGTEQGGLISGRDQSYR